MGRPTKAEQEAKLAALNGEKKPVIIESPDSGQIPFAPDSGQPQPNTHDGIIQKEGVGDQNNDGLGNLQENVNQEPKTVVLDGFINNNGIGIDEAKTYQEVITRYAVNAIDKESELNSIDSILETGNKYNFTPLELSLVSDRREELSKEPNILTITETILAENEEMRDAGVVVGDTWDQSDDKVEAYRKTLPIDLAQFETQPLLLLAGLKPGDLMSDENEKKLVDFAESIGINAEMTNSEISDKIEAYKLTLLPPIESNPDNYVYHCDHLNEWQIHQNLKLTGSWDEVTAPEHLAIKP